MKRVVFLAFCLLSSAFCFSQDIHFAQLAETPQLINPSLTGLYDGFYRGAVNYRNQWPAMGKAYNTFSGAFDMPLAMKKKKGGYIGLGAFVFSDKAGDTKFGATQFNVSVSAIVPVSAKAVFSSGLQLGFAQHHADLSAIQWPNQYNGMGYDPSLSPNENLNMNSFSYFDMGLGINYEYKTSSSTLTGKNIKKFDIGASFFHGTQPLQKFYSNTSEHLYGKLIVNSALRYDVPGSLVGIAPSFIYMMQGPAMELNLGILLRYKLNQGTKVTGFYTESAFSAGLHYRFKDAISPQVYFEFSDYGFGLSYDFNVSTYGQVKKSAGGFEISIKYANMRGAARKGLMK